MDKDIIVIGGGPGGYVAAIRGAQLGAKVCLIEKDRLGGTCLNRGCIPTKALYRNAEVINTLKKSEEFGININGFTIDVDKIQNRKNSIIDNLAGGIEQLLKANGVEVINGTAAFKDKNTLSISLISGEIIELTSNNIIIATGSTPSSLNIPGANLDGIYTSEDILNFESIPKSLAVIGGGVVGMELACIMNSLGTEVTVIEYLPSILAQVDSDITKRLAASLKRKGINIKTSSKVSKIEKNISGFIVTASDKKGDFTIESEKVLMAAGRTPNLYNLNLETIGIEFSNNGINVDSSFETNIAGIYAIGDVNGKIMLAHAASYQGILAAEKALGLGTNSQVAVVPSCIFVFPEIASAGITEDEAKKKGIPYKASKFMFGANGKALTLGEGDGFVKVISTAETFSNPLDERIIGIHIMGPHASDLIHEGTLAITKNLTIRDIKDTIHAHPTLSEAFSEAVLGLAGEAIHLAPIKKL